MFFCICANLIFLTNFTVILKKIHDRQGCREQVLVMKRNWASNPSKDEPARNFYMGLMLICGVWSVCLPDGLAPVMHLLLWFPPPLALPVVFIAFDNALNLCIKWGHVSIAVFRIPVRILQYLSICLYLPLEFCNFL